MKKGRLAVCLCVWRCNSGARCPNHSVPRPDHLREGRYGIPSRFVKKLVLETAWPSSRSNKLTSARPLSP